MYTLAPGEASGNDTHVEVLAMAASTMMPKLRARSVELDALREGVREWLCVLQPDLAPKLRDKPWPEIYRLFGRMLEANKPL